MGLKFSVLASGSTGNSMVVACGETKVLVDAGLSMRKLEQLLKGREIEASQLDAILVTHEHSDHIKGLGTLSRKYGLPIYANENTWAELDKQIGEIAAENRRILATGAALEFGDMWVESYGISHDAAEPVGYCLYSGSQKLSLVTDLGYMSEKVKRQVRDSDVLILEANHDVEMLRMGHYPWNVKRRILGDTGHLSNEAAGEALLDVLSSKTKRVYLAHLSRHHNLLELARMTVAHILEANGISPETDVQLMDTYYDRSTEWDDLDVG